jgi:hypothetical protein
VEYLCVEIWEWNEIMHSKEIVAVLKRLFPSERKKIFDENVDLEKLPKFSNIHHH